MRGDMKNKKGISLDASRLLGFTSQKETSGNVAAVGTSKVGGKTKPKIGAKVGSKDG
jgi:hypothetical protein